MKLKLSCNAKRRKKDYSIGRFSSAARSMNQALQFTQDEDLVGIEENRDRLILWLTSGGSGGGDLEQRSSKVATVWGMPGVGKTTLVSHVYSTVKVDFDAAAWVTVSETYRLEDVLRKIAADFSIAVHVTNVDVRGLAESIHNYLQGKKYILVLDDVWNAQLWLEIRNVFPTSDCTGRFVITSRKHEVSLLATRDSAIHLEPLQEHHSWVLFCKRAFWNDDDKECPLELQKLAFKFIRKCQGLPIALACIGCLLSCKPRTSTEWENVHRCLDSQLAKDVIPYAHMILKVSLEDLPYGLMNCFLHCALFPEYYVLRRKRMMRQWIAAGFIREKYENRTLEEVAEGYLTELVNRSLLQVVGWNHAGRMKCYRMHDVIRLLARNKAKEECFGEFYNGSATGAFSAEGTRRISVLSEKLEQLSQSGATHLRALHVFNYYSNVDFLKPTLASSTLLSTLDLQGTCIKMLPNEVFDLFNLRYLGLRDTYIESLPEAVGRLQNLEVLDAFRSKLTYLPNNVVKLQKLTYLYAYNAGALEAFDIGSVGGVKVSSGIQHLAGLRALQFIKASSEFLCEVGALTELRTFSVCNVRSEHSTDLSNAITRMSHLVHLDIGAAAASEVLRLERLRLPPTLSWLGLGGQLDKISMPQVFSSWSHLKSLTRLTLSFPNINEDTFSCLHMLRGLCFLELIKAFEGKRLDFYAGSFPKLRYLHIWGAAQLNQVRIEEGAMQNLVELWFGFCPDLEFLPDGIEHLRALEKLRLVDTSEELVEKLRRQRDSGECSEDLTKIRHIKRVTVQLSQKGISERI